LCRVLKVSTSGYYAWNTRGLSARAKYHRFLIGQIERVHQETKQSYGSVKTWKTLNAQGVPCGKHQVARLRKIHGIESKRRRRFKITTKSKNNKHIVANRLNRHFHTPKPNKIWVGDVTFIATKTGWLYLAVMLDLYSRKIVGWSMSSRNDKQLALSALKMAIEQRNPGSGLLHHTDRGAIYSSDEYRGLLLKKGCISSMSRSGNCYDNAVAESFFSSLKNEWMYKSPYESRNQARSEIFKYIEIFYNRQRIHQSLNYLTPEQFERQTVT
jgi:putative transposase